MTNVYQLPNGADQSGESAEWLAKLDRGLTEEEEARLRAWLDADSANRARFLAMARLWDNMNSLAWLADLYTDEPKVKRSSHWRTAAAVLAVFGLALVGTKTWMDLSGDTAETPQTALIADQLPAIYETAVGEQSTVRLAEGTELVLNTNSQVHVRLTKHHRLLTLVKGEAHIDVASDPNRPLSLVVQDKIFQALGTAFSVELDADENIELVVTEGRVLVGQRPRPSSGSAQVITPVLPASSTTVDAGQELRITSRGLRKMTVSPDEIAARLSWRQGNLIFRGESLEEALREVSKYTTIEFVFLNDAIKLEPIAGRYKAGDVETLLAVLRENVGIAYERTDDNQILLSKQP